MALVIASSIPVGLSSGALFVYSVYGPQLAAECRLDSSLAANLSISATVGSALGGLIGGYITDTYGSQYPVASGWVLVSAGYYWLRSLYLLGEDAAHWMLVLAMFLVGAGSTASYFAAIKAVTVNAPKWKGLAQSVPIALFAISSLAYSFVFSHILKGDVAAFILVLAVSAFVMQFVGVIFIRIPGSDEEPKPGHEYSQLLDEADGPVGEPALMAPEATPAGPYHHLELREILTHKVFWAHFALIAVFQGLGQMYIYTVGYILKAVHYYFTHARVKGSELPDIPSFNSLQALHVSLIAIGSFTGRLSSGALADYLVNRHGWKRHSVLVLALVIMGAGHSALIFPIERYSLLLWLCNIRLAFISTIIGYAYGFGFTSLPAIIADLFSMKNYSLLWGIMYSSTVPGLTVFTKFFGYNYDKHSEIEEGDLVCTQGYKCYDHTFGMTGPLAFFLVVLILGVSAYHRKRRT